MRTLGPSRLIQTVALVGGERWATLACGHRKVLAGTTAKIPRTVRCEACRLDIEPVIRP